MKKNAVIFGASVIGKICYDCIRDDFNVLFFADNNYSTYKNIPGLPEVLSPDVLLKSNFDIIYVTVSPRHYEDVYLQLINKLSVPPEKINNEYVDFDKIFTKYSRNVRNQYVEQFARYAYLHDLKGSIAELGVFRGDFAKEINRVFPDRKLYLFDTFEGFNENDINKEKEINQKFISSADKIFEAGTHKDTSVELVVNRLPSREKTVVKKGFFPDTFDIHDEMFCFVNIDMDLYAPIKAGLELFFPLMVRGGIILVHDYFCTTWSGAKQAADEFCEKNNLSAVTIGDYSSIMIVK